MRQMFRSTTRTEISDAVRSAQIGWLDGVLARSGWSLSRLAKESGVSDTTLTRFRNSASYTGRLSPDVVAKIVARTGVPGPDTPGLEAMPTRGAQALREEAARWVADVDGPSDPVAAALAGRADASAWVMKSDILALSGIRAGDVLIIDQSVEARDGDIVCAQQEVGLGARTLFRLWQYPNLVAASFDPTAEKPLQVDGRHVYIVGVMTDLIRRRG